MTSSIKRLSLNVNTSISSDTDVQQYFYPNFTENQIPVNTEKLFFYSHSPLTTMYSYASKFQHTNNMNGYNDEVFDDYDSLMTPTSPKSKSTGSTSSSSNSNSNSNNTGVSLKRHDSPHYWRKGV